MTELKPKKKKFKYTREVVRIALDDGMTQQEIADLCRVQQSKVSAWSRGESKALEHEVAPLKKRFGHRLNRTTSRVYLVAKEEGPPASWEDTERARRLLEIQEQLKKVNERLTDMSYWTTSQARRKRNRVISVDAVGERPEPLELPDHPEPPEALRMPEALAQERSELEAKQAALQAAWKVLQTLIIHNDDFGRLSLEELIRLDQEDFEATRRREQVTQVEGPIVLRYTFMRPAPVLRGRTKELTRLPVARWLIHQQPDGRFVLVTQTRRTLTGGARWRWWDTLCAANQDHDRSEFHFKQWKEEVHVECADDAARWLSRLHGPMDAAALLSYCDEYFSDSCTLHGPHDESALPFLLRKMLVEQGLEVPGLVRLVASE